MMNHLDTKLQAGNGPVGQMVAVFFWHIGTGIFPVLETHD